MDRVYMSLYKGIVYMIIDYKFSKSKHQLTLSYTTKKGGKGILKYDISRFKTYVPDPNGDYEDWNGGRTAVAWTDRPGWMEFRNFIKEMPKEERELALTSVRPKLYTWDIETDIATEDGKIEFPDPQRADHKILNISIVNEDMDVIILGIKKLDHPEKLQSEYDQYLAGCKFYQELGINHKATIRYIQFESEKDMLAWFLRSIVAKAPVLAGWNSMLFDWQYIINRINNHYPEIPLSWASITGELTKRNFATDFGDKVLLSIPSHTFLCDMMDIIKTFDMKVMPIKESMSLDYVASSTIGMHKIEYSGDLQALYDNEYFKFVFYNAIDSVLVQLLDKKFNTLAVLETQSLLVEDCIQHATSKIALSEDLFWNYFYDHGIRSSNPKPFEGERGELLGAYVKAPIPGLHRYVSCNDFSSLYPSTIITCNLSIENYLGSVRDGTFKEEDLEKYRQDPKYFVSVNGSVYKNDKDYAFKNIQAGLKKQRSFGKYLSKELDATIMSDIEHIQAHRAPSEQEYHQNIQDDLKKMGFDIKSSKDISKYNIDDLKIRIKDRITYLSNEEQSIKILMNSMYGGSSHVLFCYFNIDLANDITGEGRNLIHLMEHHIPQYFQDNWFKMKELHKQLGIKLKKEYES